MPIGESAISLFHSLVVRCRIYSACCALAAFCYGILRDRCWRKSTPLQDYLVRAIAAGAIPPALVLVCGAFNPTILAEVQGLEVYILLGGLTVLYLSVEQVRSK
jgi:hypothetical protein